ncbi:hypothetical protein [Glycomyces harbinensis]|uniref:Uncharacterized protein n=1 Tax=Glycomyces harbinensis TaxID=58114 RepID=A0A1G6ZS25_9ACTN|nr:hypothetical protein [Glycomyces harbinensis]SDE05193.1 hypothetical protein SAMN05216270_111164 [Glycomyces harbinensis]
MSSTDALASRTRREGLRVGWIMLFSALTLLPLWVWQQAREPSNAVEAVTAFMEAVHDKDLERAYSFIDSGIPAGEAAAFLHPDAIGDWDLLSVEQAESSSAFPSPVSVTIGTDEGTAEGSFTVYEHDGEFTLYDPFQTVTVSASSYLSVQVNDRIVPMPPETTWQAWYLGQAQRTIQLLPGVYRFFGGEEIALIGEDDGSSAEVIGTPLPEPAEEAAAALQVAVDDYIDDCVEYRLTAPPGCPFATDGLVDTDERHRVEEVRDPVWTVDEYPVATAVPGTGAYGEPVLLVEFTDPGRITLQGSGTEDWGTWEPFTAACRFGGSALHVLAGADGSLQLAPLGEAATDTCRGTE